MINSREDKIKREGGRHGRIAVEMERDKETEREREKEIREIVGGARIVRELGERGRERERENEICSANVQKTNNNAKQIILSR